jgi:branched-chain amino acid transport system ATP-binding protein
MLLEVHEIDGFYDIFQAIFKVSLNVGEKEVVCLLGRNGAGKSTTLSSIVGLNRPRSGSVRFKGKEVAGLKSYQIAQKGIGFVPEDRWIFSDLTVKENLELGWRNKKNKMMFQEIYQLFPKLKTLGNQKGGNLSGGEQQMLTIARTLMGSPDLLLLDEPTAGLAPVIVQTLASKILELKEKGLAILLAEQNAEFALSVSDRVYAIDKGSIVYEGPAENLKGDADLMQKYLGAC